jgi:hypothetical protein
MTCVLPAFILALQTATGVQYQVVDPKDIPPSIKEVADGSHEECRRRKLGDCLTKMVLFPDSGHVTYLCGKVQRAESNDRDNGKPKDTGPASDS